MRYGSLSLCLLCLPLIVFIIVNFQILCEFFFKLNANWMWSIQCEAIKIQNNLCLWRAGGHQGWNQNGPNSYNPNPSHNYQNNPGNQSSGGGSGGNWSNNDNFGCNYQQGFGGGPMRSNYNNQRSNPYGNNNCPPNNYGFGKYLSYPS